MKQYVFLMSLGVIVLTGCSNVKEQLGVGRQSPDEFTVVKRAPLTLPPDYHLPPPTTDTASSAHAAQAARNMVLGEGSGHPSQKSGAEAALLGTMKTSAARSDIRALVDQDNGVVTLKNKSVKEKLMFWQKDETGKPNGPAPVVDAKKESERLKKNKAAGQPVNKGDVPVIDKKPGTFDKIFGSDTN